MPFNRRHALIAGGLYLLLVLVAPVRLVYIQNELFGGDSAAAAVARITANAELFRLGIATDLFCATLEVFLTLALYRLFRPAGRQPAVLMAVLGLMPVPLYFVNVLGDFAIAHLVLDAPADGTDATQAAALVGLAARLHEAGIHMLQIFWGAWLFPLAVVAWRSGIVPRVVAAWLVVNGAAYLALSLSGILAPQWAATVALVAVPAQLGEIAFTVALLWRGLRGDRRAVPIPDAAPAPAPAPA
ncbi:DUF4386 domain-containing protein [Lysobacter humi (ex Lee et al. 2017)]